LRNVLHNQVGKFENLKVEWVNGHVPTAFLYNDKKEEVSKVEIGDKDLTEVLSLLESNGFVPTKKKVELGDPVKVLDFEGHTYELYKTSLSYEEAYNLAALKKIGSTPGHLLTITSAAQNDFVASFMDGTGIDTVWLGANDQGKEGTWVWVTGPENGIVFWQDGQTQTFAKWREQEPNNVNMENCATFSRNTITNEYNWNDVNCANPQYSVLVEYSPSSSPAPSTDSGAQEHTDL